MTWKEQYGFFRSWIIYYGKPFNRKRLKKFYSQFIAPGDLVFDIGAHLGNRSEAFLDLGAKVIAVEPQPICIHFLSKKFKNEAKFTLKPVLIANVEQEIDFYINSSSPTISTAREKAWQENINLYSAAKPKWDTTIKVPSRTLDHLIHENGLPSFCKIDTEGFEYEVLSGLTHPIKTISIEYLEFDKVRIIKCFDKMQSLGRYLVNFSPGESQKWLWEKWKPVEQVKNILCSDTIKHRFGDFYFKLL